MFALTAWAEIISVYTFLFAIADLFHIEGSPMHVPCSGRLPTSDVRATLADIFWGVSCVACDAD